MEACRRTRLILGAIWLACGVAIACAGRTAENRHAGKIPPARNLLVFLFDAAAADHFGAYGYPRATTPNVDRLAREGILFRNCFATAPYTLSAVASLFTSKYPPFHGALGANDSLSAKIPTLPEYLRSHGFRTAAFESNLWISPTRGFARGFDLFQSYETDVDNDRQSWHVRYARLLDDLQDFLSAAHDQRVFVLVHVLLPHNPYQPPLRDRTLFCNPAYSGTLRATSLELIAVDTGRLSLAPEDREHLIDLYDADLRYRDTILGRVLRVFEDAGSLGQTDVIVTSDHGEAFGQHGRYLHNSTVYDEMIHVPFVFRRRGRSIGAMACSRLTDSTDLFPTVLDLLGLESPPVGLQGQSLIRPTAAGVEELVLTWSTQGDLRAVRSERSKFILHRDGSSEYYLMGPDPRETTNLATEPRFAGSGANQYSSLLARLSRMTGTENGPKVAVSPLEVQRLRSLGYLAGGWSSP